VCANCLDGEPGVRTNRRLKYKLETGKENSGMEPYSSAREASGGKFMGGENIACAGVPRKDFSRVIETRGKFLLCLKGF